MQAVVAEPEIEYANSLENLGADEKQRMALEMEVEMYEAAKKLDFERAARLRDMIKELAQVSKKRNKRSKR